MEKRQRIAAYEKRYMADYGFEAIMVAARQRLILELLGRFRPKTVLEIGCGVDMLGAQVEKARLPVEQWIIVEPAQRFFNAAQSLKMGATRVLYFGRSKACTMATRACSIDVEARAGNPITSPAA